MAYQWFDDFTRYGTGDASRTAMSDGLVYASLPYQNSGTEVIADPDPNVENGLCLQISQTTSNSWLTDTRIALPSPTAGVIGIHARYWMPYLHGAGGNRPIIVSFLTVGLDILCYVMVQPNGALLVVKGDGTTIADSVVPLITPNAWHHIEAIYNSSDGTGQVYVNGVQKIDFTGGTTGTTALIIHSPRSGTVTPGPFYMKDYGIWDGTGTENNSVAGTVIVGRRRPNADITLGGWVPSEGTTGYTILAKDAPDDDTYLSADDTPPAAMQYAFEDINPDATSIRAVMSVARMRKTDGGDSKVQMGVIADDTAATGTITFSGLPTAADTVVIGDDTYKFVSALADANDVLIGADATETGANLGAAINAGEGEGTVYGTGTVANPLVTAADAAGVVTVTAIVAGTGGNSIVLTENATNVGVSGSGTLSGGDEDIDLGSDRPITSAFSYWYDISELSPSTTDPWTPAEFNDALGQVDRTL